MTYQRIYTNYIAMKKLNANVSCGFVVFFGGGWLDFFFKSGSQRDEAQWKKFLNTLQVKT